MDSPDKTFTKEKAIKRILILIFGTIALTALILYFLYEEFPVKPFLIIIAIFVPFSIICAIIGYKYRQKILPNTLKVNVKNYPSLSYRFLNWPFTKEQALKWQKPANILLRIKLMSLSLFCIAAYSYFYLGRLDSYTLGTFVGGMCGVIFGIFYYYAVKSGKITFEK